MLKLNHAGMLYLTDAAKIGHGFPQSTRYRNTSQKQHSPICTDQINWQKWIKEGLSTNHTSGHQNEGMLTWTKYMGRVRVSTTMLHILGLPADISFFPYSWDLTHRCHLLGGFKVRQSAPAC